MSIQRAVVRPSWSTRRDSLATPASLWNCPGAIPLYSLHVGLTLQLWFLTPPKAFDYSSMSPVVSSSPFPLLISMLGSIVTHNNQLRPSKAEHYTSIPTYPSTSRTHTKKPFLSRSDLRMVVFSLLFFIIIIVVTIFFTVLLIQVGQLGYFGELPHTADDPSL